MSDVLGMTATEFVLARENQRLMAENKFLKEHAGPQNIYSAATEPQVIPLRSVQPQLNIAVQTYCRDDGYGYHVDWKGLQRLARGLLRGSPCPS